MSAPFPIPPLPGEILLTITEIARRAGCSRQAIWNAVNDGRVTAATVAGRILIAESEADRFVREWPMHKQTATSYWREYREWKAGRRAAVLEIA